MKQISIKEQIFFSLACNEKREYQHWYSRFLLAQFDIDRIKRVIKRTRIWFETNPILKGCFPHATGRKTYKESLEYLHYDITKAPAIECPFLLFHSGKDKIIPDGDHVCANYLDEVIPMTIDWLLKQFNFDHLNLIDIKNYGRNSKEFN